MDTYLNLNGKVIVVTGASSGLGEELTRGFARVGCTVYMGARNENKLKALAEEIKLFSSSDTKVVPLEMDVTAPYQVSSSADYIVEKEGRIDIWVNNAGVGINVPFSDQTPEQIRHITEVNYFGLVYGTLAAAQHMKKQGQGDIVQILSTSAFTPRANEAAYCAAKAAAEMYTQCAQKELQSHGIRVIPVRPGGMSTNFAQTARLQAPPNAMKPHDIADLIINAVAQPRNILVDLTLYRQG